MFPDLTFEDVPVPPGAALQGLGAWVAHVREQDMPAFGHTVAAVRGIVADEGASAGRLASVILRDPAMTTKVLRLANSAYFNAARQGVSTISRAIVVLGFDVVADMAIGLALVDALLAGGVRKRVVGELARCFLAASLARGLARMRGDGRAEEVFIAALLSRLGEMAFWCFGGAQAEALDARLPDDADADVERAAQQGLLGFRLSQLSVHLAREWRLGGLLGDVLEPAGRPAPLVEAIRLGHRLAQGLSAGAESVSLRGALAEAARFVARPADSLIEEVRALADEAAHVAAGYGADEVARRIPARAPAPEPVIESPPVSRAERQLAILRELSQLILAGGSFTEAVNLAAEGILQGVGFARVVVALVTPNRTQLIGKYALGEGGEALRRCFVFTLGQAADDPIDVLFVRAQPVRLTARRGRLSGVGSGGPACMAPIVGQGRAIGVLYAEREARGEPVDDEAFFAFAHFVQHLSMALQSAR